MSVSCKCIKPFLELLQIKDRLDDAVGRKDPDLLKDVIEDALSTVNLAARECGAPPMENIIRHLEIAAAAAKRIRVFESSTAYNAEEGLVDSIHELKRLLQLRCGL